MANTTEPSVCSGDAALCQITLTTCFYLVYFVGIYVSREMKATATVSSKQKWIGHVLISIQSSPSQTAFKSRLKTYLFNIAFNGRP